MVQPSLDAIDPYDREHAKSELWRACKELAARCDGASTADGVGFNGTDAASGRMLANTPSSLWPDEWVGPVATMLHKYRGQLSEYGVDPARLVPLEYDDGGPIRVADIRTVTLDDSGRWLVMRFGYDPNVVTAVRGLPGRQWDAEHKLWKVPLSRRDRVVAFAEQWSFLVEPAVLTAQPPAAAPAGTVSLDGEELTLRFDRQWSMIAAVKALPSRRWDAGDRAWRVPVHLVRMVRSLAQEFSWATTPEVDALPDVEPDDVPVSVEESGGSLLVRFPFDRRLVEVMRGLPDSTWDGRRKAWVVPVEHAMELLSALEHLRIGADGLANELIDKARMMLDRIEASRALDADLEVDGLALTLHPFQRAGVKYAADVRRCLICDEMGLGKTPQALATLQATQAYPAVVMVPAVVKVNWRREAVKFLPHLRVAVLSGIPKPNLAAALIDKLAAGPTLTLVPDTIAGGGHVELRLDGFGDLQRAANLLPQADLVIVNYDVCGVENWSAEELADGRVPEPGWTPVLKALPLRGLVADECHGIKNPKAQRTRMAIEVSRSLPEDGVVLGLTGTPVLNRRAEVAAQLDFIGRLSEFGGAARVATMSDLARRLRARCMVRRMKSEVAPELPPRLHVPQVVPIESLDRKVMADYRKAEADLLAFMADRAAQMAEAIGLDPHSAAMEARMRARGAEFLLRIGVLLRLALAAKQNEASRWIKEFLATGKKLLVFSCHLAPLDALAREFGAPVIKGGVSPEQRSAIVDRFQNDESMQLVLLQIDAGGVGLTMTAATDVLFLEQAWSPAIHDQAIDRCYGRLNDMHGATGWYLLAENTLDEWVADLLEQKRHELHDATNGDVPSSEDTETNQSVYGDLVVRLTRKALGG